MSAAEARDELIVSVDGRSFRRRGFAAVDLSTRRSMRLMLERLAYLRLTSPGVALTLDDLFAIGWPGENIIRAAAHRRVYTAIGMLRDFGLRGVLLRRDDGYLLSPEAIVVFSALRAV